MSLYVHHLESEKQEVSDMTTYIEKKSMAVAESIKLSVSGNLKDRNYLGFSSPKIQKKPKLSRPRSGRLYTPRDPENPKEHTPNRVPQSARVKSSAPHFRDCYELNLKSGKDIEVPVPPPTPRDPPETREDWLDNNRVEDEGGIPNESFTRNSTKDSKRKALRRFSTIYESFDDEIGDDDQDLSILNDSTIQETLNNWENLNSKFEARREQEGGFNKKKRASQAHKEAKTAKKLKSHRKKQSKPSKDNKKPSSNITDPSDLSSLVGKVSLKKLTEMNQKMFENQRRDAHLHPYVQDYLKNQVFTKYPVTSQEAIITDHPVHCDPNEKISLIKIVKDLVGKDISKITLPCYLNEPGSTLSKIMEDIVHKSILDRASKEPDQYLRLGLTAAACFVTYSVLEGRTKKPINPLLGETLEMIWEDVHGIAEQVSHHPPISAKIWMTKDYSVHSKKKNHNF